jgi:Uma2 family endonuclease
MSITGSPVKLSYEDYLHFPEDGRRHELIEGDHHVTPSPNTRHQRIALTLTRHLAPFVAERDLGQLFFAPFDVVLGPHDIVQPDLLFVGNAHLDRITEAHLRGAPDLVVEIVSESTRGRDEVTKRHLYERHGVPEYWIVDPVTESVKVYRLAEDSRYRRAAELSCEQEGALESPFFPGFSLPLRDLFA